MVIKLILISDFKTKVKMSQFLGEQLIFYYTLVSSYSNVLGSDISKTKFLQSNMEWADRVHRDVSSFVSED